jgi:nicotinamide riboside kinase
MTAGREPLRVVLIGPECTGKTWLAADLAGDYQVPWSTEYARTFVDAHPRPVEYSDVEAIGRGQVVSEDHAIDRARQRGSAMVIHDTDLVSTWVYSRHYFDDCPGWIATAAAERLADLYLLHDIDAPWIGDGHQRIEPERREELFALFRGTLEGLAASVVRISGGWAERRACAVSALEAHVPRR